MSEYLLTIKVPIDSRDDIEAREKAKSMIYDVSLGVVGHVVSDDVGFSAKLQEVYPNKEPRKIPIGEID